jgi:hypothetical protein
MPVIAGERTDPWGDRADEMRRRTSMLELKGISSRRWAVRTVVVGALAFAVVGCAANAALPTAAPPATPVVTPTPVTSPQASAGSGSVTTLGPGDVERRLAAGTYTVGDPFAVPFTMTLGSGPWTPYGMAKGEFHFGIDVSDEPEPYLAFEVFDSLYPDPCHTEGGSVGSPDMTIDQIAEGFTTMTGVQAGPVTDVQIDGRPAKRLTITNTIDTDTEGCTGGVMLPLMRSLGGLDVATNGNMSQTMWIVDVDGTRVVIWGETLIASPDPAVETVETVLETIDFD